jgi:peptidoglycan/xylan/chitin deacetylase (PgdA/CDA1 family)
MEKKYLSLCYHYLRTGDEPGPFKRILGPGTGLFNKHLDALEVEYDFIDMGTALDLARGDNPRLSERPGMLITFDDGLSDHYTAAKILHGRGIRAVFFIPTCVIKDKLPANPIIVHYGLSAFGVGRFLDSFNDALDEYGLISPERIVRFDIRSDDPWAVIARLKHVLKYEIGHRDVRNVLLSIYRELLEKKFGDILEVMHLVPEKIREMLDMGHSIGTHSHTHISVASSELSDKEFFHEMVEPKHILEDMFGIRVRSFSYPFGRDKDCLHSGDLVSRTREYEIGFTINPHMNTAGTDPFRLGRFMPPADLDEIGLVDILSSMIEKGGKII